MVERIFTGREPVLMHGGAYDGCVMLEWFSELKRPIWQKYEDDGVVDSLDTERIIEISTSIRGKLSLDELARRYGVDVRKSCVRLDFGRYWGRPVEEYTREHVRYAKGDAAELHALYRRQRQRGIASDKDICDLVRGSLWLRLCSNYGIRTDASRVGALESSTQELVDEMTGDAQQWGGMRDKRTPAQLRDGAWFSRNMAVIKGLVLAAYGARGVPRTDGWDDAERDGSLEAKLLADPLFGISTSREVLEESGDPRLEHMASLAELLAVRNKDVKMLKAGISEPIHTRFGYAETTRTTSGGPNLQNFRRAAGIRECLMPRPGRVFLASDYPGLESFTLAQVIHQKLGRHTMLDSLNAGRDLHAEIGAGILGVTYEELRARIKAGDKFAKNARDCGKYGNFGLTGYMTDPETFAFYVNHGSRTPENPRGLQWTPTKAAEVMALWRRNAHDQVAFLRYVDTLRNEVGLYDVEIPSTTIVRRGCTRTAAANTHFQGLGAVVARRAGWHLAKAQYIDHTHPGRTVLFVHDEFVTEVPEADVDEAARIQEGCMLRAVEEICPDVRLTSEALHGAQPNAMVLDSAAMRHYSKAAKHERVNGRIKICET